MMGMGGYMFDDEDEIDIDEMVGADGRLKGEADLAPPLQSKISNSSRQRCKVIGTYIEKLQEDIRVLKEARAGLMGIKDQLEKEKPDVQLFERVSKEAIVGLENLKASGLLDHIIEGVIPREFEDNNGFDLGLGEPGSTQSQSSSGYDSDRDGHNEHDKLLSSTAAPEPAEDN